jgi:peptide chain release factor 1
MIQQKLQALENRFREVEKLLSDPAVISRNDDYKKLSKEHSYLSPIVQKYGNLKKTEEDLRNLDELKNSTDTELQVMAASEHQELAGKKARLEAELKLALIPPDPNDDKNIIVEIRAGTGGDEAALFAGDLFRMYSRHAETKGWKIECLDMHPTGLGGFKEVVFSIIGKGSWGHYKFERGIHRVQRVPETEASGRIHTSAVTVAVLPEAEDIDVEIKPDELRIDTYRASGAGGQHVNKTESAVRITHIPTNTVVACQDERSQMKNRAKAMRIIMAKVYEAKQLAQQQAMSDDRRAQVGSGDRSEKIRTYNFPQNRITDHRIDFSLYRLKEVLNGDMDELFEKLIQADNEKKLSE